MEVKENLEELEERLTEGHARQTRKVVSGVTRKIVGLSNFLV